MSLLQQAKIPPLTSLQTNIGKEALYKGFDHILTNSAQLETRGNTILCVRTYLRDNPSDLEELIRQFKHIKDNEDVFESPSDQVWQEKTSEQIFFAKGGYGEVCNHIPGFIAFLTFLKIWLAPAFGILSPLLLFILPYFMLLYVYKMPITWTYYQTMVLDMMFGQQRSFNINTLSKILYFVVSLSQTVAQPFFTSIAVAKLDTLVRERSKKIKILSDAAHTIVSILSKAKLRSPALVALTGDVYCVFAQEKDQSWKLQYLKQILGSAEVIVCLARDPSFQKPTWTTDTHLEIRDFSDSAIVEPKQSSVLFTPEKAHALLTGPNRGGKSSSLRGILQNVLWAQCYGVAPSSYKGPIFHLIDCSLRAEDRPGIASLFEREIEIATSILQNSYSPHKKGLVLIDELFHSTNPPDGERTARLFLDSLWKKTNVISCVSTHVYTLVESASPSIQKLCCNAKELNDGSVTYYYSLTEGICKVSSVLDVLRETGFLASAAGGTDGTASADKSFFLK